MKTNFLSRAVAACLCGLMMTGCGDVVIKVKKEPKNVDLSALENFSALNLQNSHDFLKHLDNLKVVAVDLLIKELASRDYRSEVRNAIRGYRSFLIARASGKVKIDDSFYASADECRSSGLNFNMDQANDFLGIILKTAVLAKLSEVNAPTLNPGISKELAAIGQIILMELGLKIEGTVDVKVVDGVTTTTGDFSLALAEIADEAIDDATKKADAVEVLKMSFTRALGENYMGTFGATIEISHLLADETVETLAAKMAIERKALEDRFLHTVAFDLGVKDAPAAYARKLTFEQATAEKHMLKLTDTINPGTASEKSIVTLIDTKSGTQCKAGSSGGSGSDKGDEGGFVDGTDDGADDTDGGTTPTEPTAPGSDGTDDTPAADDGSDDGDAPKGSDGDDDAPEKIDDQTTTNTPGQNPGQHPGQHPGQTI